MSLSTIADTIYDSTERVLTRKQAHAAAQAVVEAVEATLVAGNRFVLPGLFSLKVDFSERKRVVHLPTVAAGGKGVEVTSRPKVKCVTSSGFRSKLATKN